MQIGIKGVYNINMNLETLHDIFTAEAEKYSANIQALSKCIEAYKTHCLETIEYISISEFDDCEEKFNELEAIHHQLSIIRYKYDFSLSEEFIDFLRGFERIDTIATRQFWHAKFKNGLKWPNYEST